MRFSVFLPPGADEGGPVPAIYALAGLNVPHCPNPASSIRMIKMFGASGAVW
jgi:hypothetical protein